MARTTPIKRGGRLPRPSETQTVRRTAHLVRRASRLPEPASGPLSRRSRGVIRRHAAESRDEIPDWAYRDLSALLATADALEEQLRIARARLAQCGEALKIAAHAVADAETRLALAPGEIAEA
jgi:hypothetical protein